MLLFSNGHNYPHPYYGMMNDDPYNFHPRPKLNMISLQPAVCLLLVSNSHSLGLQGLKEQKAREGKKQVRVMVVMMVVVIVVITVVVMVVDNVY